MGVNPRVAAPPNLHLASLVVERRNVGSSVYSMITELDPSMPLSAGKIRSVAACESKNRDCEEVIGVVDFVKTRDG